MTTVVAVDTGHLIHIAADGRSTCGSSIVADDSRKIHCWEGGVAVAHSGYARPSNLLRLIEGPPDDPELLWQAIKDGLRSDGYEFKGWEDHGGGPAGCGEEFLFALPSGLWHVDASGAQVRVPKGRPCALGSGGAYALGAAQALLEAQGDSLLGVGAALLTAVRVAARFDSGTGGKILVVTRSAGGSVEEYEAGMKTNE